MDAPLNKPGAAGPEDVTVSGAAAVTAPCCGGGCTCCHAMLYARQEVRQLHDKLAKAARAEAAAREAARQWEGRFEAELARQLEAEKFLAGPEGQENAEARGMGPAGGGEGR